MDKPRGSRIVVVGAGAMGRAAIGALLAADSGVSVTAVDASPEARETLNGAFARQIDSGALKVLTDVTRIDPSDGEAALLFLPKERVIEAVLAPENTFRSFGAIRTVVDFGTNSVAFSRRMAALADDSGLAYLDAPVLGRPDKVGSWVVPVGGAPEVHAAVVWILDIVAVHAPYIGPAGSGAALKLLNQLMFGAINAAAAEIAAIAEAAGIDRRVFFETVTGSSAATVSGLFKAIGKRVVDDEYDSPTFTIDLLAKDVGLARDLAESVGLEAPLIAQVVSSTERAQEKGLGALDTAAAWLALRDMNIERKGQ